jgi:hypothetical protein
MVLVTGLVVLVTGLVVLVTGLVPGPLFRVFIIHFHNSLCVLGFRSFLVALLCRNTVLRIIHLFCCLASENVYY